MYLARGHEHGADNADEAVRLFTWATATMDLPPARIRHREPAASGIQAGQLGVMDAVLSVALLSLSFTCLARSDPERLPGAAPSHSRHPADAIRQRRCIEAHLEELVSRAALGVNTPSQDVQREESSVADRQRDK